MARLLNVSVPEQYSQEIISKLKGKEGLLSLAFYKNASLHPPGDIISIHVTNNELHPFMRLLEDYSIGKEGGLSIHTSEQDSIITTVPDYRVENDGQEAIWEEVNMVISKDSNMSKNILAIMVMAGIITTVGLATSTIHIVIGGMLLAPGFMPIMRITLGLVNKNPYWYYGLIDTLKGYFTLMLGAVFAAFLLRWTGLDPLSPEQEYYQLHNSLIDYWTKVTLSSIFSSAAATVVGTFMLITKRTIFTSGVMIALALVPAASLVPIGLIFGEFEMAGKAAIRFGLDVGLILVISYIIFSIKQRLMHRRTIKL
jgi:hypothetical protein